MAISNHERVGRALKLLAQGLYPFIEREMRAKYGDRWLVAATPDVDEDRNLRRTVQEILQDDIAAQLKLMWSQWNNIFRQILGHAERSLVSELRDIRNTWAHGSTTSSDDAYRALDSASRLLSAISAPEADAVDKQKYELLRVRFDEQARQVSRRAAAAPPTDGQPTSGLKPWREIATPHPDVAAGTYQQAEFAADLWEVFLDRGSDEYRDPTEFYRRTFLTDGLRQLLTNALTRLSGKGGDPVIELQTNFGGGKTHAMLALYHLCMGASASDLPGMEPIFQEAGVEQPPDSVNVAVLVGNKITPGQRHHKKDGTIVHTLWGELAYQLGGKAGYDLIREADETSTNPGDALKDLFDRYAPCLILIDEWVAYARQLHDNKDLPAGDFDTHFTFAQTLSESAKNAKSTLLLVSIPASDIEVGGERGKEALDRLKNAIGRVESPWRPASAEESFEIVRRRLFQSTTNQDLFVARDAVIKSFADLYRNQSQEFPPECREAKYEIRMRDAYPIHPELFDRLYSDWSSLEKFQRTRGVLRLMAKTIHTLWERGDKSLLIMPGNLAMEDAQVQSELTRYLEDNWIPILERDVDGPNSLPKELDSQNPNLGRYSACRRVTRTIYLGSAPTLKGANRGIEDRRIKLGCVQPGESVATFGDALRRLTDQATYLYVDGNRYWISTQPNVTRTAQDRATQLQEQNHLIVDEIVRRLRLQKQRGDFAAVHIAPESTADIPDDSSQGVRLVVLGPDYFHLRRTDNSPGYQWALDALNHKGASPRYFKNLLTFLVPDKAKVETLQAQVAQHLAWQSILNDTETLNLDAFQRNQARTKCQDTNTTVDTLLESAYEWLLAPEQLDPQGSIELSELKLSGKDSPILRASQKLIHEGQLITTYAGHLLEMEVLSKYLWQDSNHIDLKRTWEYLAQYVYLPRLKDPNVLLSSVAQGVSGLLWREAFAYADAFDEAKQRYRGLKGGEPITPILSHQALIVKPAAALAQLEADEALRQQQAAERQRQADNGESPPQPANIPPGGATTKVTDTSITTPPGTDSESAEVDRVRRFFGAVELDALRYQRDFEQIAEAILQHLNSEAGTAITVTLEIQATAESGFSEQVVRTVTENCNTLKFTNHDFEES